MTDFFEYRAFDVSQEENWDLLAMELKEEGRKIDILINNVGTLPMLQRITNYKEDVICGLDECGCVSATARGACKTGVKVIMLTSCIGSRFSEKKVKKQREKLTSLGVIYRYE